MQGDAVHQEHYDKLEAIMKCAVKAKQPFERLELTKEELLEMFKYNKFKVGESLIVYRETCYYRCVFSTRRSLHRRRLCIDAARSLTCAVDRMCDTLARSRPLLVRSTDVYRRTLLCCSDEEQ